MVSRKIAERNLRKKEGQEQKNPGLVVELNRKM